MYQEIQLSKVAGKTVKAMCGRYGSEQSNQWTMTFTDGTYLSLAVKWCGEHPEIAVMPLDVLAFGESAIMKLGIASEQEYRDLYVAQFKARAAIERRKQYEHLKREFDPEPAKKSCVGCQFLYSISINDQPGTVKCLKKNNPSLPAVHPADWNCTAETDRWSATCHSRCEWYDYVIPPKLPKTLPEPYLLPEFVPTVRGLWQCWCAAFQAAFQAIKNRVLK